jgi:hypothetical protein
MTSHTTAPHAVDSRKVSEILAGLAGQGDGARIKLGDIVAALGERAFGVLMLVLALPNAIGLGAIPGVSTVFGAPQIVLALQMMVGRERPWLPAQLLERSIARADFERVVRKATPHLQSLERYLRPRWAWMSSYLAERLLGVVFLVLATIVSLPIVFGNQPPAIAMAVIALGVIERDGAFAVAGLVVAAIALVVAAAVVAGGVAAIYLVFSYLFGG